MPTERETLEAPEVEVDGKKIRTYLTDPESCPMIRRECTYRLKSVDGCGQNPEVTTTDACTAYGQLENIGLIKPEPDD